MLNSVRVFLSELRKVIDVREAYLFGSYAKGDWLRESDVDLIVISEDFKDMKFTERLDLVNEVSWRLRIAPPLEVIPLTPDELKEGSVIVEDARKYWVRVL